MITEQQKEYQKQWDFLIRSSELNKLPHALLFCGQEKIGKKDLAIEFAKFFVNQDITKGTCPDFILVEPPASTEASAFGRRSGPWLMKSAGKGIQIGQIRALIQKLYFKPYSAEHKLAIIDKADLMTQEAQNCFLKFLEEPSDKSFLILITAYPDTLLPTILSRVQKIRFFSNQDRKLDEQIVSDLIEISSSDLAGRFEYAKNISKENLKEILDTWLVYLRKVLIFKVSGSQLKSKFGLANISIEKLKEIIKQIQSTQFLLSTTNANPKLALEILLMKF
ncbi:MAG: hypothetical protein A2V72_01720 [Candidatus Nealsonbacteria bacterium RBG_13_37_56]|uniref:DNA polymerase III subunit delta n=1 Tax=Candidatus Nealsonbacteria bacterium RBG_13_37_56 TaxID=1801661 RepID=A0A1G2DYF4_9BACT|nr:MAG: hypothetical protein A2V72_01720 [Candidatus Nealsonbacteria bacterium RBG_13_37_56]